MAYDRSRIEHQREQRREHAAQLADELAQRNITPGPDPGHWDVHTGPGLPSGWPDDHGLELPALLLAVDAKMATADQLVSFHPDRRWLLLAHQYAGVGCRQLRLVATPLTPAPGVADKIAELHELYYDTSLGAFTPHDLQEVISYRAFLTDELQVDCRWSYPDLAESVYPIDPTPEHLAQLAEDDLPDDLDELLEFYSSLNAMLGSLGRWKLLAIAENSD